MIIRNTRSAKCVGRNQLLFKK